MSSRSSRPLSSGSGWCTLSRTAPPSRATVGPLALAPDGMESGPEKFAPCAGMFHFGIAPFSTSHLVDVFEPDCTGQLHRVLPLLRPLLGDSLALTTSVGTRLLHRLDPFVSTDRRCATPPGDQPRVCGGPPLRSRFCLGRLTLRTLRLSGQRPPRDRPRLGDLRTQVHGHFDFASPLRRLLRQVSPIPSRFPLWGSHVLLASVFTYAYATVTARSISCTAWSPIRRNASLASACSTTSASLLLNESCDERLLAGRQSSLLFSLRRTEI